VGTRRPSQVGIIAASKFMVEQKSPKDANWMVVSFHSVPAEELIEERPRFQPH